MPLSLHQSSVGVFQGSLTAFLAILDKAAAHAEHAKFDPAIYSTLRLLPNMLAFPSQVHSFCDQAKNGSGRLAGVEPPKFEDTEKSLPELKGRIEKTLSYISSLDAAAIDQGADREIVFPIGGGKRGKMLGADYLNQFVLRNFYFHLTTAYDILRQAGVEIGKRDFLGQPTGLTIL